MKALRAGFVLVFALGSVAACEDSPVGQEGEVESIVPELARERPIGDAQTEGYGRDRLLVFDYTQNFACPPGEVGQLPCVVGQAAPFPNSLDLDPEDEPDIFIIVPFFDADGDGDLEALDPDPAVDVQCPEPGEPFGTCTMHPGTLETPLGTIPLPNHSHVVRDTPGGSKPWDNFVILVTDADVWPDKNGNCPADPDRADPRRGRARSPSLCLTSLEAIRDLDVATQTFGGTGILETNLFLFFGVHGFRDRG